MKFWDSDDSKLKWAPARTEGGEASKGRGMGKTENAAFHKRCGNRKKGTEVAKIRRWDAMVIRDAGEEKGKDRGERETGNLITYRAAAILRVLPTRKPSRKGARR